MKIKSTRYLLYTLFFFLLLGSTSYGVTINYGQSEWDEEEVRLKVTGTSIEYKFAVVYEGSTCVDRAYVRDWVHDGTIVIDDPNTDFAVGDDGYVMDMGDATYVCFQLEAAGQITAADCYYVCDYPPSHFVPTLTEWGMITLVLLLLAAGVVTIVRKRRAVTAR